LNGLGAANDPLKAPVASSVSIFVRGFTEELPAKLPTITNTSASSPARSGHGMSPLKEIVVPTLPEVGEMLSVAALAPAGVSARRPADASAISVAVLIPCMAASR
jgi:hypothetical protein